MPSETRKATRGRPKTFDRDHVIAIAMQAYWQEGHAEVSLNAICQRAGVSKPSLYKEFGGEDGLKQAVLIDYHALTLAPLYAMLEEDQPFDAALQAFYDYLLRDHHANGMPNGCLFVDMCQHQAHLGQLTKAQVERFRALSLHVFAGWITKAQAKDQLSPAIAAPTAALYLDAQIANLMALQRQGVAMEDLNAVFRLAMSVFDKGDSAAH